MRRTLACFLSILMICSLMLAGCAPESNSSTPAAGTRPSFTHPSATEGTRDPDGALLSQVPLGKTGKIRVPYTINVSSVRYITSVDMLPNQEGLEKFDDAYFKDHALLIVMESVKSGSTDVQIDSITVENGIAFVKLSHLPSGPQGSGTMTTWLIWAEVERGLQYHWEVVNPALDSNISTT